jgi:hypothetical protein
MLVFLFEWPFGANHWRRRVFQQCKRFAVGVAGEEVDEKKFMVAKFGKMIGLSCSRKGGV